MSVFEAVLAQLPACSSQQGEVLTLPFLDTCRLVLPVIGAYPGACRRARDKRGEYPRACVLRELGRGLHARARRRKRKH